MRKLHTLPHKIAETSRGNAERTLRTQWLNPILIKAGWTFSDEARASVHEELTGMAGRADVALKIGKRVRICIEVKSPRCAIGQRELTQAAKYGRSYYVTRDGYRDPVMTVCTNGLEAHIMDPALDKPTDIQNVIKIKLDSARGIEEFKSYLRSSGVDNKTGATPGLNTVRIPDKRNNPTIGDTKFRNTIFKIARDLIASGRSIDDAISMTMQLLLLAAARDNGAIPNATIRRCEIDHDWPHLAKNLNKIFGDVFESNYSKEKIQQIWKYYEPTTTFDVRLDVYPTSYIGAVYEEMIQKFKKSKTSFYTPEALIDQIIENINPGIRDTVLDPTCGSASMLARVVEHVAAKKPAPKAQQLVEFMSRVVGVDKDRIACQISKVTLLCTFMRIVGEHYQETSKPLPRPQIQPACDFMKWRSRVKFTCILGNPPWDSIDNLSSKDRFFLQDPDEWLSYEDKNDQLCYIVEKSIRHHLVPLGRFGFVVKLQSLSGFKYQRFAQFLDRRVEGVIDYGDKKMFNNDAQTAIIYGRAGNIRKWSYEHAFPREAAEVKTRPVPVGDFYQAAQGSQSSADDVYRAFAADHPKHPCIRKIPVGLTNGGAPREFTKMAFFLEDIPDGFKEWSRKTRITRGKTTMLAEERLLGRGDVVRSGRHPYAWRHDTTGHLDGPIITTERILSIKRDRFPVFFDLQRKFASLTGHTCIASIHGSKDDIFLFGALMISSYFLPSCRFYRLPPRGAGSIFLSPEGVNKRLKMPTFSANDRRRLIEIVSRIQKRGDPAGALETSAIDSIVKKYYKVKREQPMSGSYAAQLLSDFLHMAAEAESLPEELSR